MENVENHVIAQYTSPSSAVYTSTSNNITPDIFKIGIWNVRSIVGKVRNILNYCTDNDYDICLISETWLSDINCTTSFIIKDESDYIFHHKLKPPHQPVGGTGILYNKKYKIKNYNISISPLTFEFTTAVLQNLII